jgi:hypothetical protein
MAADTVLDASVVPQRAATPGDALELVRRDGAAVVGGLAAVDLAIGFATAILGEQAVRVAPQFEATTSGFLANQAKLASAAADSRGRVRRFTPPDEVMPAHNDGYGFGDLAPDYLFLWCERSDPSGGASWLLDGALLLDLLAAQPESANLARFCWDEAIDHSEPGFVVNPPVPIARRLPSGRVQVRHNPYLAARAGAPDDARDQALVDGWCDAVRQARDRAERFRLEPGELLCVDNYRVLHGRDGYLLAERKVVSIWGWSHDAVDVPDRPVAIV